MPSANIITIERFILAQERMFEEATGDLTNLLYDIALAGKIISGYVRRAGIVDVLGPAGNINIQGEAQQKTRRHRQRNHQAVCCPYRTGLCSGIGRRG